MARTWDPRSTKNLVGIHADLVRVMTEALQVSPMPFVIIEGMRTRERQAQLVKEGKSKTMNSRHLTGHAVDVGLFVNGQYQQAFRPYAELAKIVIPTAARLSIPLRWGGDWDGDGSSDDERFLDGVHYELPRSAYP